MYRKVSPNRHVIINILLQRLGSNCCKLLASGFAIAVDHFISHWQHKYCEQNHDTIIQSIVQDLVKICKQTSLRKCFAAISAERQFRSIDRVIYSSDDD